MSVVAVTLILAAAVSVYARAVTTDVPRWGAEAEREWDASVAHAMRDVAAGLAYTGSPAKVALPSPGSARALDVPLLGRTAPVPPSGAVTFDPDCATFTAEHAVASGAVVEDLLDEARGCVAFEASPAYTPAFGYVVELGGVVRTQGERAVVLAGPSLDVAVEAGVHEVSLSVPTLSGTSATVSAHGTSAVVQVTPTRLAPDAAAVPNAASATWELETEHPSAWRLWFRNAFLDAGLLASRPSPGPGESPADFEVACVPADCSTGAGGRGLVRVALLGPLVDGEDLVLSLSHGAYSVSVS